MFDSLTSQEARPILFMKRAILSLAALCFITALASGYRAYYQVQSLELWVNDSTLRGGSTIQVKVVGSGRTTIDVRLELIQGAHAETLLARRVPGNDWASFDPRPRRAFESVSLTSHQLSRFLQGAARLRATATGRKQWTRLPPPTVREIAVEIDPE